jgi:hypothetical protein
MVMMLGPQNPRFAPASTRRARLHLPSSFFLAAKHSLQYQALALTFALQSYHIHIRFGPLLLLAHPDDTFGYPATPLFDLEHSFNIDRKLENKYILRKQERGVKSLQGVPILFQILDSVHLIIVCEHKRHRSGDTTGISGDLLRISTFLLGRFQSQNEAVQGGGRDSNSVAGQWSNGKCNNS